MDKLFTLQEANSLLPILESLLKQAIKSKALMEDIDELLQNLGHKIFLSGGLLVDVATVSKSKSERENAIQRIKDAISEILATGVQVKDIEVGLLDFPHEVDGETVLLCWKLGEPLDIQHWHGTEEGFAGRKPIATLLDKKEKPERPN
ncbi:MAG: hypothetical protein JWO13_1303 [Acidobacteriales bacterium]|nr:hypothetical protein [Terriglobales bacterium]